MNIEQITPGLISKQELVITPYLKDLTERVLTYLRVGYPVNLSGPAGTGKTTIALYLASTIGRPVVLLHGSDEITSAKLIGGNFGYRKRTKIDNYIHSVENTEESLHYQWLEGLLSTACRTGMTLIYDEFTRTRPEVNNLLLSILEEKVLSLPGWQREKHYLKVHPEFKAIFTSNPEEYAGVHYTQVALADRMINMEMAQSDFETETYITAAKSGLPENEAAFIVGLVRKFREQCKSKSNASVRSSIRIAVIARSAGVEVTLNDESFSKILTDVLLSEVIGLGHEVRTLAGETLQGILDTGILEEKG